MRRCEEEDEDEEAREGGMKGPLPLFIRQWIDGMRGNRGGWEVGM